MTAARLPKRAPQFSGEDYARRLAAVRVAMDQAGLDALIVSDPANGAWLTGADAARGAAHQAVLLTLKGAPYWWGPAGQAPAVAASAWMAPAALIPYAEGEAAHPCAHLARALSDLGVGGGAVGLELDSPFFTAAAIGALLNHGGRARYVDATGLVNRRRLIKSPAELEALARAAILADRALETARAALAPGAAPKAIAAEIAAALLQPAQDAEGGFRGDPPAAAPIVLGGAETAAAPLSASETPLEAGAPVLISLVGAYRRYQCPLARTLHLGAASDGFRRAEAGAQEALEAIRSAARPGASAGDLARAGSAALRKRGLDAPDVLGRSTGLAFPPDWTDGAAALAASDETELGEGAVLHVAPRALGADGDRTRAAVIGQSFVVGPGGGEPLSALAPVLPPI